MAQLRAQGLETCPESVQALLALLWLPADVVDECAKVHRLCQVRPAWCDEERRASAST